MINYQRINIVEEGAVMKTLIYLIEQALFWDIRIRSGTI